MVNFLLYIHLPIKPTMIFIFFKIFFFMFGIFILLGSGENAGGNVPSPRTQKLYCCLLCGVETNV